jgi:hypothetical protein
MYGSQGGRLLDVDNGDGKFWPLSFSLIVQSAMVLLMGK